MDIARLVLRERMKRFNGAQPLLNRGNECFCKFHVIFLPKKKRPAALSPCRQLRNRLL